MGRRHVYLLFVERLSSVSKCTLQKLFHSFYLYNQYIFFESPYRMCFPSMYVWCVCFLPIHSGHQAHWTYQPGSHRRKVTQDFSHAFFLRCMPYFFSREGFSHYSFPSSTVKSNFVYCMSVFTKYQITAESSPLLLLILILC